MSVPHPATADHSILGKQRVPVGPVRQGVGETLAQTRSHERTELASLTPVDSPEPARHFQCNVSHSSLPLSYSPNIAYLGNEVNRLIDFYDVFVDNLPAGRTQHTVVLDETLH